MKNSINYAKLFFAASAAFLLVLCVTALPVGAYLNLNAQTNPSVALGPVAQEIGARALTPVDSINKL